MTKVFVHGNPEVDAIWGPLVDALAALGIDDVVLLSPPGFGAPTPVDWDASMTSYAEWLVGEITALAPSGPVDIVGHDWGAGHVFGALTLVPGAVRSWATDVVGLLHPDYEWHDAAQAWQTPDVGEQVIDAMVAMTTEERSTTFESLGLPPEVRDAMAAGVTADMGRCILALYRDAAQPAMVALGERLGATALPPGLAIIATADAYVSADHGRSVGAELGAETLTLDGLGHWWMVEDPAVAAAGLARFWASLA